MNDNEAGGASEIGTKDKELTDAKRNSMPEIAFCCFWRTDVTVDTSGEKGVAGGLHDFDKRTRRDCSGKEDEERNDIGGHCFRRFKFVINTFRSTRAKESRRDQISRAKTRGERDCTFSE